MSYVEFPGLGGLKIVIDRIAFVIFGLPVYWYGIILAFSFLLAVLLALRKSREFGIEPENILDMVLFAAPAAIIAARLFYVVFSWGDFKNNLLEVFNTRNGGLAIYGAVIGASVVVYFFTKKRKINVLKLFDFCVPYLILAQSIGRWGNFVNQEAFGTNTSLPWGMSGDVIRKELEFNADNLASGGIVVDPSMPVHPTFLYESLWNLAVFALLIWFRKRKKLEGEVLFLYIIFYGAGRAWIEGLRTDSLMLGIFRISQVIALLSAVLFLILFFVRRARASKKEILEQIEADDDKGGAYSGLLEKMRHSEDEKESG